MAFLSRAASGAQPRKPAGGVARRPYANASRAGDRRHAHRARPRACHPAGRLMLSVDAQGFLRLSQPPAKRGERLPFDYLLTTLATALAARVVCVILSGAGADGSLGLARGESATAASCSCSGRTRPSTTACLRAPSRQGRWTRCCGAAQIAARLVERKNGPRTTSLNENGGGLAEIVGLSARENRA